MNRYQDREITKLVCFCASEDSSIVEYLQNEESYLLKLCREPDTLEQIVDAVHPDLILIDCSGKISNSVQPEMLIELDDVVDSESIDYAAHSISNSEEMIGSNRMFRSDEIDDSENAQENEEPYPDDKTSFPPIIIPDYLSEHLHIRTIANKGQILFIFKSDPGMAVRRQCLDNRCDLMVLPFLFEELKFRIGLHANQKELNYRVAWQKETLNRAVDHIDNLKQIIVDTRKSWSRENEILHNSLKQINMMSNDRDIMKNQLHVSRVKLFENIKGVNSFLWSMIESRNEHQKGHSKRVAEIAEFVGEKKGLEPKSLRLLKNAAMLHEVGMLLIPSSILNKMSSEWSDYEKSMMLYQPSNGAAYLEKCPGFEKVAEVIRHLHENSDGTGYPQGLKKRYIPLLSKILAGADVLDQIWIDNPYASIGRLLEILEGYAGSRLDPTIVNILEKYVVTVLNFRINHNELKRSNKFDDNRDDKQSDNRDDNTDDNQSDYRQNSNDYLRLKEVAVYQLKPGMVLGTGLFTKTGTKLFSSGTTLTSDSIRMLEKYSKEYPVDETVFIKVDLEQ
ncbi:MAG: HD domain-containing protein [Desulfamplus sp.]|nr:HD domain-containing protein [Desulfamplus sp.]